MLTRREILNYGVKAGLFGKVLISAAASLPMGSGAIELTQQSRDAHRARHMTVEHVDPKKVGIIAVDCWHYHSCRTWRSRAGLLIPRFNYCFDAARELGMTLETHPESPPPTALSSFGGPNARVEA